MSIGMMAGLPERVIQVLKDFLPAELDLLDTELADGITTTDIAAADYYEWDREVIPEFPACSLRIVSSTPIEVRPKLLGKRVDARHRIDVLFHVTIGDDPAPTTDTGQVLQDLLMRYVTGALRVLMIEKEALETTADDVRFVNDVTFAGEINYGPEVEQDGGALVRTATLPISIRRIEER